MYHDEALTYETFLGEDGNSKLSQRKIEKSGTILW